MEHESKLQYGHYEEQYFINQLNKQRQLRIHDLNYLKT